MTLNIASCLGLIWGTSRSHIDFVFDATWLSSSLLESMVSESSPSTRAAVPTKDQYHHYIPRFILRRFQVGPRKTKAERKREYRRTGIDPEYVLCYDFVAGTLDTQPIGGVYGVQNLYKDVRNLEDVNELEKKLSVLESEAATVIADLHKVLDTGKFHLKRGALERLRKFLFVMHYRKDALSTTYFQEDHPENACVRKWMESFRTRNDLQSSADVWLHVLRYYLDTPHWEIISHASKIHKMYGKNGFLDLSTGCSVNPEAEHVHSLAYETQADRYFLCIWRAADGEEFILSQNGFGLWEGSAAGSPGLHRLYVVSPQIAIILRSILLRPETLENRNHSVELSSALTDINQHPPTPSYRNGDKVLHYNNEADFDRYRASKEAEEDTFAFQITMLTPSQTHAINAIILKNTRPTGYVTFISKDAMLNTTRKFCSHFFNFFRFPKYELLLPHLTKFYCSPLSRGHFTRDQYDELASVIFDNCTDAKIWSLLRSIVDEAFNFTSEYNKAYRMFLLCSTESPPPTCIFAERYRQVISTSTGSMTGVFGPPPRTLRPQPSLKLVETLPQQESNALFKVMSNMLARLGLVFEKTDGLSPDEAALDELLHKVVVVGILSWLGKNRHDYVNAVVKVAGFMTGQPTLQLFEK